MVPPGALGAPLSPTQAMQTAIQNATQAMPKGPFGGSAADAARFAQQPGQAGGQAQAPPSGGAAGLDDTWLGMTSPRYQEWKRRQENLITGTTAQTDKAKVQTQLTKLKIEDQKIVNETARIVNRAKADTSVSNAIIAHDKAQAEPELLHLDVKLREQRIAEAAAHTGYIWNESKGAAARASIYEAEAKAIKDAGGIVNYKGDVAKAQRDAKGLDPRKAELAKARSQYTRDTVDLFTMQKQIGKLIAIRDATNPGQPKADETKNRAADIEVRSLLKSSDRMNKIVAQDEKNIGVLQREVDALASLRALGVTGVSKSGRPDNKATSQYRDQMDKQAKQSSKAAGPKTPPAGKKSAGKKPISRTTSEDELWRALRGD
jgi:hypothetical protein